MEEHALAALELQRSREQLRALLIPDPLTGRIEADAFPRSQLMRFVFSAGKRNLAMSALGAAFSMFAARRRAGGSRSGRGGWARVIHSVAEAVGSRRR
jgi:hypothetical protein